jgi:ribonuclease D
MKKIIPTKSEIALMEPFVGLTLERVHVPTNTEEFAVAHAEIKAAGIVGFDTESKPTFAVGEVSEGPHLVQFALSDKAYLFQLHHAEGLPFLLELLQSEQVIKVGFGLQSDSAQIYAKLGIRFSAVGLVFNQRFIKSKKVTTSNWSQHDLTPQQLLYAANDAYAALKVLEVLNLPCDELPIMGAIQPE